MHVFWFVEELDGWGVAIDIPKCWLYKAKMAFFAMGSCFGAADGFATASRRLGHDQGRVYKQR